NIELTDDNKITIEAADRHEVATYDKTDALEIDGKFDLVKGAYNHIIKHYGPVPSGFKITTYVDAPAGSGLGSSSTLMVAIIGAFSEWLQLPMGEYDMANTAYFVEREELRMA